ncbi:MAG: hypothetical protein ACKOAU_20595, partial [Pirellula sp.]
MQIISRTISVTVDTEEEGLWGGTYKIQNCTTENLRGLPRFQELCEKYSIPPTYLIDAPVLGDKAAIGALRSWLLGSRCEIGTHCHPWCNPPIVSESVSNVDSYLCNLPEELQFEKLSWLTEKIADTFGRAPTSYRAGRYGFSETSVGSLAELNYLLDSSVLPAFDYRESGGPSFLAYSRTPCVVRQTSSGKKLIEVPITTGFTRIGGYELRKRLRKCVETPLGRATKLLSLSNRFGVTRHVKLSPEGTTLGELKGLVRASLRDGVNHLVLMLHSTSLMPGFSPYAKDRAGVESLYERLEGILDF